MNRDWQYSFSTDFDHRWNQLGWRFGRAYRAPARPDGAPFDDLGEPFKNLVSIGWIAYDEQLIEYPRGKVHVAKTCRFAAEMAFDFSPTLSA